MSDEYIFGAHMLEILTRGMYEDSKTIFREYVQNSCDSIDAAMKDGTLQEGEGRIEICLDDEERTIRITDNGTGIKSQDFRRVMGNVADSDKRRNENRGFRGIGRLCGMAYCRTVIFTAKFRGENIISRLECNSGILRELLNDRDSSIRKYTASEVLELINEFGTEKTDDTGAHYFIVELEGINDENTALLDYSGVKDYLSFTAPVPYSITFDPFSPEIHKHAEELGLKIDEYDIFLNDEQIFKPYEITYHTKNGNDIISSLEFLDVRDEKGKVIAWMWFGISSFRGQIDRKQYLMWGIRLRKGNIQIGNEYTMQKFFTEDRGNRYFIGELFCVDEGLIPNARRDYFNENQECAEFDSAMRKYAEVLANIYKRGSDLNSSFRKIKQGDYAATEIKHRINNNYYEDTESLGKANAELEQAESETAKEQKRFDNISSSSAILCKVAGNIQNRDKQLTQAEQPLPKPKPKYTQNELRLIRKIFTIIHKELGNLSSNVVKKIEEGLGLP
ncbi:MAG: ATP-binding protein [Synergistaceae bacterium]|nr:ATP-binding protein [Synergistaceae bacterium]MBQ6972882.1 ATP-binding protein [Synergistaceae bacterium]